MYARVGLLVLVGCLAGAVAVRGDHGDGCSRKQAGDLEAPASGPRGPIWKVAFSPDGCLLAGATTGDRPSICVWDIATGGLRRVVSDELTCFAAFAWQPRSKALAFGVSPSGVEVRRSDGTGRIRLEVGDVAVKALSFSRAGTMVAACAAQDVLLYNMPPTGRRVLQREGAVPWAAAYSPDGRRLLVGYERSEAVIWDVKSGDSLYNLEVKPGYGTPVSSVAWSRRGKLTAVGCYDGAVQLWDTQTRVARTLESDVRLEPDVVLGLWSRPIDPFPHLHRAGSLAFSPDGGRVVTASGDEATRMWDTVTGRLKWVVRGGKARVGGVDFSPSGMLVASADGDWERVEERRIRLLDAKTGRLVRVLE